MLQTLYHFISFSFCFLFPFKWLVKGLQEKRSKNYSVEVTKGITSQVLELEENLIGKNMEDLENSRLRLKIFKKSVLKGVLKFALTRRLLWFYASRNEKNGHFIVYNKPEIFFGLPKLETVSYRALKVD